jgi:hypothetical protein
VTGLPPLPPGYVAISVADLAALLSTRATAPPAPQPATTADTITWEAISACIALLGAKLWQADVSQADVIGELPAGSVVGALTIVAASVLAAVFADRGEGLLGSLGLDAAKASAGDPGGTK